jgi:hypothetical protein
VPLRQIRSRAVEVADAERQKIEDAYAKLPVDAPLWDYLVLLPKLYGNEESEANDRIRKLARLLQGLLGGTFADRTPAMMQAFRHRVRKLYG